MLIEIERKLKRSICVNIINEIVESDISRDDNIKMLKLTYSEVNKNCLYLEFYI